MIQKLKGDKVQDTPPQKKNTERIKVAIAYIVTRNLTCVDVI